MSDLDLEAIVRTVVDTGEKVAKQAVSEGKKLHETMGYNTAILSEKRKVDSYYKELGKKYFKEHKDDPEAEYADDMNAIVESLNVIEDYEQKVNSIKAEVSNE